MGESHSASPILWLCSPKVGETPQNSPGSREGGEGRGSWAGFHTTFTQPFPPEQKNPFFFPRNAALQAALPAWRLMAVQTQLPTPLDASRWSKNCVDSGNQSRQKVCSDNHPPLAFFFVCVCSPVMLAVTEGGLGWRNLSKLHYPHPCGRAGRGWRVANGTMEWFRLEGILKITPFQPPCSVWWWQWGQGVGESQHSSWDSLSPVFHGLSPFLFPK